jgi:phosphate uptake regulator
MHGVMPQKQSPHGVRDVEVNAMNSSLFRELLTYMLENPRNIASCLHMSFCAKTLERMGDHAAKPCGRSPGSAGEAAIV